MDRDGQRRYTLSRPLIAANVAKPFGYRYYFECVMGVHELDDFSYKAILIIN